MKSRYLYHYPSFSEHFPTQTSAPPSPVPHSSDRSSLLAAIPHRRRIFRPKSPVHWTNRRLGGWLAIHLSPNEDGFAISWLDLIWNSEFYEIYHGFQKNYGIRKLVFLLEEDNLWVPSWFLQVYIWTVGYLDPIYSVIECQNITWVLRASILKQLVSSVAGCFFSPLVGKWE